jgi:hypothetical protein
VNFETIQENNNICPLDKLRKLKKLKFKKYDASLRQTDISNISNYIFIQLKAPMILLTSKFTIKKSFNE